MAAPQSQHQRGFTLVELVLVLLVASIVAITAGSRFFASDDAKLISASEQTLALLRQVQLTSMQDTANLTTRCPTLVLSAVVIGVATTAPCTSSAALDVADPQQILLNDLQLQVRQAATTLNLPVLLRFDSWGRPQGACANGCTVILQAADEQRQICISNQGYAAIC